MREGRQLGGASELGQSVCAAGGTACGGWGAASSAHQLRRRWVGEQMLGEVGREAERLRTKDFVAGGAEHGVWLDGLDGALELEARERECLS